MSSPSDPSSLAPRPSSLTGPRVVWLGPSPLQADELVRVGAKPGANASRSPFETKQVEAWLTEKLSAGPRLASEISFQAELDAVPPILLRRARISLNIIPSGRNGSTTWQLPEFPSPLVGEGLGVRGADRQTPLDHSDVEWAELARPTTSRHQPPNLPPPPDRNARRSRRVKAAPIEPSRPGAPGRRNAPTLHTPSPDESPDAATIRKPPSD